MLNLPVVFPPAITTDESGAATPLSDAREIVSPLAGAALEIDTTPVADAPPLTVAGDTVTDWAVGAVMVRAKDELPALILATASVATALVLTRNPAEVSPFENFTLASGVAAAESLDRANVNPPLGAGDVNVNVPATLEPPTTDEGDKEMLETDWADAPAAKAAAMSNTT